MPTTLTHLSTTLPLAEDMLWSDEFSWQAVQQNQQYTIAGALVVEAAAKLAGRPITLSAGEDFAWVPRSTLDTLRTWALLPAQTFTLLYRGVTHSVMFDHAAGALDAQPVIDYSDPTNTDDYAVTLRFIKV